MCERPALRRMALWSTIPSNFFLLISFKERGMTQKVIEVIGTSKESFAKAATNAVAEAGKTVRGIKWAHVDSLDMQLDGKKVVYRATTKIYFDVEH
jgi:dodecin